MSNTTVRASRRSRHLAAAPCVALEMLESRTLLSAACMATHVAVTHSLVAIDAAVPAISLIALSNSVSSSSLPASIVSAKAPKSGTVKVKVVNSGSVVTPKTGKVNVVVALRPTAGGADIVIGSKTGQAFANIKAGTGFQTASVSVKVPITLATGSYTIVVTVTAVGFTPDANNVATGSTISIAAAPSSNVLGNIGSTITVTSLIDSTVTPLPGGLGSTTLQHWNFVDSKHQTGELFLTQNYGALARAADAVINFFPNGAIGSGSVVLKGVDIRRAFAVGTQLSFGTSGSIACTTDSYTHKTCKVSRVG